MAEIYVFLGLLIPAVTAITVALIKTQRKTVLRKEPLSPVEVLQEEVDELKLQLERQHIKIDDISERLAWLEGKLS